MKTIKLFRLGSLIVAFCLILAFALPANAVSFNSQAMVAAGYVHTLALDDDGTVWVWGWSGYLIDSSGISKDGPVYYAPVKVNGLSNVVYVDSGGFYSAAVEADGSLWELGNGNYTPVKKANMTGVVSAAVGHNAVFALKSDGTV